MFGDLLTKRHIVVVGAIKLLHQAQLLTKANLAALFNDMENIGHVLAALLKLQSIGCLDQQKYSLVLLNSARISDITSMLEDMLSSNSFLDAKNLKMLFACDDMCLNVIHAMSSMQSARILNASNFEVMIMYAKFMPRDAGRNNLSEIFATLHRTRLLTQSNFDAMAVCLPLDISPLRTGIEFLLKEQLLNQHNLNLILSDPESAIRIARKIRLDFYPKALQQLLEQDNNKGFWRLFGWSCMSAKNLETLDFKSSLNLAKASNFMRDFTSAYDLYHNNTIEFDESKYAGKTISCSVCTVTDNTAAISLNCGHSFHLSCMENGIKFYIDRGSLQKTLTCAHQDCNCAVTPLQLAKVISGVNDVVKFQRMLIRATPELKMCPVCPNGVERSDKLIPAHCNTCGKDNCFECGEIKHSVLTCEQTKSVDKSLLSELLFFKQLVKQDNDEYFGKCPHCRTLLERISGCEDMICGRDYDDANTSVKSCGKEFDWDRRITVRSEIAKIERSFQNRL